MELRDIIEAEKTVTSYGKWQKGKIPASAFPVHKQRRLKLSNAWNWRCVEFEALDNKFAVLIRLNVEISNYYANLAHVRADGYAVICSHDLHTSHRNWHCHFVKGDITRTNAGYMKDYENTICYPSGRSNLKCSIKFEITLQNAMQEAARRFRFEEPPQGELLL